MKKKVLIDLRCEIDLPYPMFGHGDLEYAAKYLEQEAKELTDFIRDHRSRDRYGISIIREYRDLCSFCGTTYEEDTDGMPLCCDKAIQEWEAIKSNKVEALNEQNL